MSNGQFIVQVEANLQKKRGSRSAFQGNSLAVLSGLTPEAQLCDSLVGIELITQDLENLTQKQESQNEQVNIERNNTRAADSFLRDIEERKNSNKIRHSINNQVKLGLKRLQKKREEGKTQYSYNAASLINRSSSGQREKISVIHSTATPNNKNNKKSDKVVGRKEKNRKIKNKDKLETSTKSGDESEEVGDKLGEKDKWVENNIDSNICELELGDYAQLGCLTAKPIVEIPSNMQKRVRRQFNDVYRDIIEDSDNLGHWKRLAALPFILLTYKKSKSTSSELRKRLQRLESGNWDIKVSEVYGGKKGELEEASEEEQTMNIKKKVHQAITVGNITKAMRIVTTQKLRDSATSSPSTPAPTDDEIFSLLQKKNPEPAQEVVGMMTPDLVAAINEFQPEEDIRIKITGAELIGKIRKKAKGIAPAADKLSWEIMSMLIGRGPDQQLDEMEYSENLARVLTKMVNGEIPKEAEDLFKNNQIIAVGETTRPIINCGIYRKLGSSMSLDTVRSELDNLFKGLQYANKKSGIEHIINIMKTLHEGDVRRDNHFIDGVNSFNEANRTLGLQQVMEKFPSLLPFMRLLYDSNGKLYYKDADDNIRTISSSTGLLQGDPLSTVLYALTALPLHQEVQEVMADRAGKTAAFVDDLSINARFSEQCKAMDVIDVSGLQTRYVRNRTKGIYLLGRCGDIQKAEDRKRVLVDRYGMLNHNVHIHPDDIRQYGNKDKWLLAKKECGAKVLGSYIGDSHYIKSKLGEKLDKLSVIADKLIKFTSSQDRMLLLNSSYNKMINHLMRTIDPEMMRDFIKGFEGCQRRVVASIMKIEEIEEEKWKEMRLPLKEGGMGVNNFAMVNVAAYVSSLVETRESIEEVYPLIHQQLLLPREDQMPMVASLSEAVHLMNQWNMPEIKIDNIFSQRATNTQTLQGRWTDKMCEGQYDRLLSTVSDKQELIRLTAIRDNHAGDWITVLPKYSSLEMTDAEVAVALRTRFGIQQAISPETTRCNCGQHGNLDKFGHHLQSCIKDNGRQT